MNTIRYIGSKKKLANDYVNIIEEYVQKLLLKNVIIADLFAGSGIVGYTLSHHPMCQQVVSNDLEYYAYVINYAVLNCSYTDKIQTIIDDLNKMADISSNVGEQLVFTYYTTDRAYFMPDNGRRIDVMRTEIDHLLNSNKITMNEHMFLNASIIVCADYVGNTAAVYTSYLKYMKKQSQKKLILSPIHTDNKIENKNIISNTAAELLNQKYDIAYLDPPYNNRQYGSGYFPLNYIAQYDKNIQVKGKTGLIPYKKSDFCSKIKIKNSFISLFNKIVECGAKLVFISYSNEGLLTFEQLHEICNTFGETEIIETKHRRYQNKTEQDREVSEFLFCIKLKRCSN
jgi:adenine-specific DNA-methyltransferase